MRVLVVDDHEVVRKGVRSLLARAGYEICGEGVDGEDALEKAEHLRPDVIVMDVSMPRLNGLEATRKVRQILPAAEILILTQHDSPEMLRQAVSAGARGYVVKSAIAKDLLNAVEKLSHHEPFFDAAVSGAVVKTGNNLDAQEILQRASALEQALRESEELYRATFDQAAVGMCHVALDGRFLRVNSKLCTFLGYSEKELLGMTFMDVTHPQDLNLDLDGADSLRAGSRSSYQIEKRYRCKDGSIRWGQLTVALMREQTGAPKFFLSVVADIDERKHAEEAFRESENRFRIMADTAPVMIWMADADAQRNFFNEPWLQFTGRSQAQEMGMGWMQGVHPEDLERVRRTYLSAVSARQSFTIEYRLRRADGAFRWVLSSGVPRHEVGGNFEGFVGSCVDINSHKELEEALRASEDQFRILANSIPQLAWMADTEGAIFWYNQRWYEYTGTKFEEMRGWGWKSVHHPKHVDRVVEKVSRSWQSGEPWEDTFPLRGKEGRYRQFLSRALPMKDDQGHIARWFGTNTDIGEYVEESP